MKKWNFTCHDCGYDQDFDTLGAARFEAKQHLPHTMYDEPSEDYPLGGSIEPYDIEVEKELTQ